MHVVFGVKRHVEVEHRWHVLDVQPAGRHIGTHQQVHFAFFERLQRLQAFVLALVTVQGGRLEAFTLQRTCQPGTAQLAVDEHKRLLHATGLQDLVQRTAFVVFTHAIETLLHGGSRGVRAGHFDGDRVLQVAAREAFDFRRERGREQQRGAGLGQVTQDTLQVRQKTDVEHAVGFVEHHIFHLVQHSVFGFDVVEQTTGGGHQHFNAFFELQRLRFHVHATKHHGAAQVGVLGVQLDLLGHLVGQLTRGQQHQRTHRVARWRGGAVFVLEHALQQGQRKSRCFAGAGLRCTHHVLPCQHHRNGLLLDRRHGLVAHFGHCACQRFCQRKIGKR